MGGLPPDLVYSYCHYLPPIFVPCPASESGTCNIISEDSGGQNYLDATPSGTGQPISA